MALNVTFLKWECWHKPAIRNGRCLFVLYVFYVITSIIVLFYDCYFKNCFITLLQHVRGQSALCCQINVCMCVCMYVCMWFKKNAPTLADYNYDPVQSILIIFSKLFVNDHKSCLVVKFSTSPHVCCHYTL